MPAVSLISDTDVQDPRVKAVFVAVTQAYGFVPNILRAMANCPELLEVFAPFWGRVYQSPAIGRRLRAIAALGTAYSRNCNYCVSHMSRSAVQAGLTDDELKTISTGDGVLAAREQAVVDFASAITSGVKPPVADGYALRMHFDDKEIVNIALAVGLYNLTSIVLQALDINLDDQIPAKMEQSTPVRDLIQDGK